MRHLRIHLKAHKLWFLSFSFLTHPHLSLRTVGGTYPRGSAEDVSAKTSILCQIRTSSTSPPPFFPSPAFYPLCYHPYLCKAIPNQLSGARVSSIRRNVALVCTSKMLLFFVDPGGFGRTRLWVTSWNTSIQGLRFVHVFQAD